MLIILIWLNTKPKTICSISIRCHCIVAKYELKFSVRNLFADANVCQCRRRIWLSVSVFIVEENSSRHCTPFWQREKRIDQRIWVWPATIYEVHVLTETDIVIVIHKREHQRWQHQAAAAAAKGRRGSHRHLVHELCWHFSYFYRTVHTNHRRWYAHILDVSCSHRFISCNAVSEKQQQPAE